MENTTRGPLVRPQQRGRVVFTRLHVGERFDIRYRSIYQHNLREYAIRREVNLPLFKSPAVTVLRCARHGVRLKQLVVLVFSGLLDLAVLQSINSYMREIHTKVPIFMK